MANVLVVTTVEDADTSFRDHLSELDAIKVVVPVVRQGLLDWLANDQDAFSRAEEVAQHIAERLPGQTVEAAAGEADVELAIRDALATFDADEILVALREVDTQGLHLTAASSPPRRAVAGVPVRMVVVRDVLAGPGA
jgi:hypothetical protein